MTVVLGLARPWEELVEVGYSTVTAAAVWAVISKLFFFLTMTHSSTTSEFDLFAADDKADLTGQAPKEETVSLRNLQIKQISQQSIKTQILHYCSSIVACIDLTMAKIKHVAA
jgi:hypothetical protein